MDRGGGLFCADTFTRIQNYTISDNVAEGVNGSGGGINFYGGDATYELKNCLLTGNSATTVGGAICSSIFAMPKIQNCTFADNTAGDLGGAVYGDWTCNVVISDSIFARCGGGAIAEEDSGGSAVTYSLFHSNPDADYALYDTDAKVTTTSSGPALHATNKSGDPLFVSGPLGAHYLSQTAAGQPLNSPAVNAGGRSAAASGLFTRTTRTDGAVDIGVVDLGYHFRRHSTMPKHNLNVTVTDGRGTVQPTGGAYYDGALVWLTAEPEAGYRLASWLGTSDDSSKANANVVVMISDRDVYAGFAQPRTIIVGSEPNYTSIQHAIDAAGDGDIVIVPTGTYAPAYPYPGLYIANKSITLTSSNPDDPRCVEQTVLSGYHIYVSTASDMSETIIAGLTIRGGGLDVSYSSPIIRNCVFTQCNVIGADGLVPDPPVQDRKSVV